MSDDDGGIVSGIADVAGDVAGAVVGELKKFGKSATSQVTGSTGPGDDLTSAAKSAVKNASQGPSGDDNQSIFGEFKKIGQSATSQLTGGAVAVSEKDLQKMAKKDDDFSKKASSATVAKMNRIYEEYAAKRAREKQQAEMVEKQKEEMKGEQEEEIKKEETNAAIQKTRPEIKNYGAE